MVNPRKRLGFFGPKPPKTVGTPPADLLLSVPRWAIFAISGMFSIVLLSSAILNLLPTHSTVPARFTQIIFVLAPLIIYLGYGKMRVPVQVPKAVIMVLLLQAWLALCSLIAFSQFGGATPTEESDFIFLMYALVFMAGAIGSFYSPGARKAAFGLVLAFGVMNAGLGILQFIKFGPALAYARINSAQDITNWDGIKGAVRIIGFSDFPENLAIICMTANGVFLGRLLVRRLNPLEYLLSAVFIGVAFAAQSRVMYLSIGLTVIAELGLVIWHDRKLGLTMFALMALVLSLLGTVASDKLAYGVRLRADDPSFVFRREIAWPQAYHILEERPVTGIGIDGRLARTTIRPGLGDINQWSKGFSVDNGILLMGCWGGYPGILIYLVMAIVLIAGLFNVCRDRQASDVRRIAAAVALTGAVAILNNSMLNNSVLQWKNVFWVALCGGMAMPGIDDARLSFGKLTDRVRRQSTDALAEVA